MGKEEEDDDNRSCTGPKSVRIDEVWSGRDCTFLSISDGWDGCIGWDGWEVEDKDREGEVRREPKRVALEDGDGMRC